MLAASRGGRQVYYSNRADASISLAESDALIAAVKRLVGPQPTWQGSVAQLARAFEPRLVPPKRLKPAALGGRLRRMAPVLRANDVAIDFSRERKNRDRVVVISAIGSALSALRGAAGRAGGLVKTDQTS